MAQKTAQKIQDDQTDCGATASHGTFCWNELMTRDVERAKQFYRDTIGWSFNPMTMPGGGTYWCAMQDGKPVAGLFSLDTPSSTACRRAGCPISPSTTWTNGSRRRSSWAPRW
jgi:hypothetical protein